MKPLAGKLLIASPLLADPNFARTVVFLLSHSESGAFGVVINRPTGLRLLDYLPAWAPVADGPPVLFFGGPVERNSAIAVTYEGRAGASGGSEFARGYGLANLNLGPDALTPPPDRVRVFVGYAGWGAGQLEGELKQDGWFIAESRPDDMFSAEPEGLWSRVLRRQGGELATLAHFPRDARAN